MFALCSIATALITWFLMRLFPNELDLRLEFLTAKREGNFPAAKSRKVSYNKSVFGMVMDKVIVLIILSFALCLVISFLGGVIAAFIITFTTNYNTSVTGISALFSKSMFEGDTPLILTEIAARIPVNIVDRLISAFAGFGIALGVFYIAKNREKRTENNEQRTENNEQRAENKEQRTAFCSPQYLF